MPDRLPNELRDAAVVLTDGDLADLYSAHYYGRPDYAPGLDVPYARNEHWLSFFSRIAGSIVETLAPTTVLDVGCAMGFLVEALRERGVEAYGIDVSEYAISQVHESVRPFCRVGSMADPIDGHYDLVTCIEVLEHLPAEQADVSVRNLCNVADRVLFSSSPDDFGEPTHLNVQPPEEWAAAFARHGFVHDLDTDVGFLTAWAMVFERYRVEPAVLARRYERLYQRHREESRRLRETVLALYRETNNLARATTQRGELDELGNLDERLVEVRAQILEERDRNIGLAAELAEASAECTELTAALRQSQLATQRLDEILRSRGYRVMRKLVTSARKLTGLPTSPG